MKSLPLSSLFLTLLFSCASYSDGFRVSEKKIDFYTPDFLINSGTEKSFRMSIEAYENHFGGIVASKKLNPNHYRFAFLNEFGGKMLDFELENQEMRINYVMEELDRKIILNLLKKDFNLLFTEVNKILQSYEQEDFIILESKIHGNPVYYYLKNNVLQKTTMTGRKKEKINLEYKYNGSEFPDVEISHSDMKIKIYLHLLDNN